MTPMRRLGRMPGGEQLDRGLLRRHGVEDHRDRRRDDDGDRARRGDQADGEALVVAALLERGIDHPAHGDDGADGGVRHRAEQFGGRDRRHRERAAHAADDRHDHVDDAPRDAALRHDLAGQHEERNGQQRKIVEAAEHVGLDGVGRNVAGDGQHRDDRGHEQDEKDRKAEDEHDDRQTEKDEIAHRRRLLMRSAGVAGIAGRRAASARRAGPRPTAPSSV